jgi:hypothetical protein
MWNLVSHTKTTEIYGENGVSGVWGEDHNKKLYNLYSLPNIIKAIKYTRRMR